MTTDIDFDPMWETCPDTISRPGRLSGAWTVGHSRLPVSAIINHWLDGYLPSEILELFPGAYDQDTVRRIVQHYWSAMVETPRPKSP